MKSELEQFVWSKSDPWKSLECHLYEAAVVIKILLTNSVFANLLPDLAEWLGLTEEETIRLVQYLAGVHDLGKAHPLFANNEHVASAKEFFDAHKELCFPYAVSHYRHERGSAEIVTRIWKRERLFDSDLRSCFADILKLHHQGKKAEKAADDAIPQWVEVQDVIEGKIRDRFPPPEMKFEQVRHMDAACTVMTALLILTDWLASSSPFAMNAEPIPEEELTEQALAFLHRIGLDECPLIEGARMSELWSWMREDSLRPLQKAVEDTFASNPEMPLLTILEAPMGEGKTEAGIYTAVQMAKYYHKAGLYVALPTAATSNQMQCRVNAFLKEHGNTQARLLHSMAWLEEEGDRDLEQSKGSDSADDLENWLKPSKRALLSPWAVGTVDQALMAVLHIKYGVLRLLGLCNKVLVIDEVHAYDAYMSDIILRLLEWCWVLRIPVVMLSATLPNEKKLSILQKYDKSLQSRSLLDGYPLITSVCEDGRLEQIPVCGSEQHNRVKVNTLICRPADNKSTASSALRTVEDGGCLCLLVNTVKRAQELYAILKEESADCPVYLFHSRFSAARRAEIESECIRMFGPDHEYRPAKAILVATQVVEQSLDLDFDAMITEIAPVDLLLQRIGRLHRHKTTVRPKLLREPSVTVLVPPDDDFGASGLIYYDIYLKRTRELIKDDPVISIPDDIPALVNRVYSGENQDDGDLKSWMEQQFADEFKAGQAKALELQSPDPEDFLLPQSTLFGDEEDSWVAAKTRLGEDAVRLAILPPSLYGSVSRCLDEGQRISSGFAKQVMLYSVSIRQKTWDGLMSNQDDWDSVLNGNGKLSGMKILCGTEEAAPYDTLETVLNGQRIVLDREQGFLIQKEGSME